MPMMLVMIPLPRLVSEVAVAACAALRLLLLAV